MLVMTNKKERVMNISTYKHKWIVAILLSAAFISILNQTLLMIAMPPIMADFQIDANQAQWLTTIYLLTNGILIPITAYLIGRFSNRMLLLTGLVLFSVGTLTGGFAPNFMTLLLARVIQAGGAGIIMPMMQTIIITIYPKEKRGTIMGIAGLVTGFAPAVGPTLAGWLIEQFSWRYLFYTMFPISIIIILIVAFYMRNVTEKQQGQLDVLSVVYSSFGWGGLLYAFSIAGSKGFDNLEVWIPLGIGTISLWQFIQRQLKLEKPILEFRVFQSKIFTLSTILSFLVYSLMVGSQILLTFYMQNVRELTALETGLMLLPGALVMGIFSPIAGKIFDRLGGRLLAIAGFSLILGGNIAFIFLSYHSTILYISTIFSFISLGITMVMMPLTTAGMNALPIRLIAHGTAVNNTLRMVVGAIITALLVTIMSSTSSFYHDLSMNQAMLNGIRAAFMTASLLSLGGFIIALLYKNPIKNT